MRYIKNTLALLITLLVFCLEMSGQNSILRNYNVGDGLPSSEIYHVIQDKKGYIWFATNMGVSRFDGRSFKNFDVQDGLPENTVFEIYEDVVGRVWFITFPFQLAYFDHDTIVPYKNNHILRDCAGRGLIPIKKSFMVKSNNDVFFSFLHDGKIYKLPDNGKLEVFRDINPDPISLLIIEDNKHLLCAQKGIKQSNQFSLQIETRQLNKRLTITETKGGYSHANSMVSITGDGEIFFMKNDLLTRIKKNGYFQNYEMKDRILWLSLEADQYVWVGKEFSGIQKYDINNISAGPVESYLEGLAVSSVLVDNDGGTWFTSLNSGVFYLSSKAFTSFSSSSGLSGKNILTIERFKGKMYIGSDGGAINYLDNGKIKALKTGIFNKMTVNKLTNYNDEKLWISTKAHLYSYNSKTFESFANNHDYWLRQKDRKNFVFSIKDLYPLSDNEIMLGQMQSLSWLKDNKIVHDSYIDNNVEIRVEAIVKENTNSYLLGTFNGLWRLNGKSFYYLGEGEPLLQERITDIVVFEEGKYVILGTKGSGLVIKINNYVYNITQGDGLSSNSVTSLLATGNDLWVATNNGLNHLKLDELKLGRSKIIIFKKEHGLISNEINQVKGDSSILYLACNGGLTIFDRGKYLPSERNPPVYIDNVKINEHDTVIMPDYTLGYLQNFITISYSGINFRDPNNMQYKYRLLGLSKEWISTRNLQVEYAFLPHGKYTFEVYAINSDGIASKYPAVVKFTIHPPYWKTWWFKLIASALTITLIVSIIVSRMRRVKRDHDLQNDIYKYRQQALIRQMDPHFVFNTLNSINSFIIKNDKIASAYYLTKFSRLMRLILNNSQKQEVALVDEIDALNLYMQLESMRFNNKFEFNIDHDQSIEADICRIPAFMVQPFVENAIWHGIMNLDGPGFIKVNFIKNGEHMTCLVEDNGVGRVKSKELKTDVSKKSLGIAIVETRLNLLSNYYGVKLNLNFIDLYHPDQTAAGTRVTIDLPIIN